MVEGKGAFVNEQAARKAYTLAAELFGKLVWAGCRHPLCYFGPQARPHTALLQGQLMSLEPLYCMIQLGVELLNMVR